MIEAKKIRVLEIDLSDKKVQAQERSDIASFLGGVGLAAQLFTEYIDYGNYLKVLENLVCQPNDLYRLLARGTNHAAQTLGGREYALTLGKNEMAGYHTGYANILGLSFGARHSHLDNAGYSIDQKAARFNYSDEQIVSELIAEEKWRNVLNSLCICLFAREVYTRENICDALACVGFEMTSEDLNRLGDEIFRMKKEARIRIGFKPGEVYVADRFFETPALTEKLERETLERMSTLYRKKAGI